MALDAGRRFTESCKRVKQELRRSRNKSINRSSASAFVQAAQATTALEFGQEPWLPPTATDRRNNEATDRADSAAHPESDHTYGLFQTRRIGIVRAEEANRAKRSTDGETSDASRPCRINQALSPRRSGPRPAGNAAISVSAANAKVQ